MAIQLVEMKRGDTKCIGNMYFGSSEKILNYNYHYGLAYPTVHQILQNCGRTTIDFSSLGHLVWLLYLGLMVLYVCVNT